MIEKKKRGRVGKASPDQSIVPRIKLKNIACMYCTVRTISVNDAR